MTIVVRAAGADDIAPVAEFLHTNMNARIPAQRWRRLLEYPWRPAGAEHGRVVTDGGRVVGFMATVFSDRPVRAERRRFCNLGAWYLLSAYRGTGLGDELLDSGMADQTVTYYTNSARLATGRKIRARGFRILDDHRFLFRPDRTRRDATVLVDDEVPALGAAERRLLADHEPCGIRRALIRSREGDCLVVFHVKLKGADIAYHEVLSADRPTVLAAHAQALADRIVDTANGVLAVDARWIGEPAPPDAVAERIPLARWFRSPDVEAALVDHLYSETVLLDLKLP